MVQKNSFRIAICDDDELRAVFEEDANGWKQEIPRFQSSEAYFTLRETEEPCEEALEEAQKSLSLNGRKLAAVLVHGKETDRLFLTVHHLVVDTVSWRILAEDFSILFQAGDKAAKDLLQPKTTSYAGYARALSEFAASGRYGRIWITGERNPAIVWKNCHRIFRLSSRVRGNFRPQ